MQGPVTRQTLLVRLRDPHQQTAWSQFVEIYEPLIYRLACSKGLQHADAQDLTQDVLCRVAQAIESFDVHSERGSFRGWLSTITRNMVLNHLTRNREVRGSGDTAMIQRLSTEPLVDPETATLYQMERRREIFRWAAKRVEGQFAPSTWQAFWLTGVQSQSIEDAAKRTGKSIGAVRIARCRVLARLRDEIKQFDEDDR